MVRSLSTVIFLTLLVTRSAGATAVLVGDLRTLSGAANATSGSVSDSDTGLSVPAAPFAPFNASIELDAQAGSAGAGAGVRASQNSTVTGSLFSGAATIELAAVAFGRQELDEFAMANGNTVFDITFQLLEPHTFVLTGLLSAEEGLGSDPVSSKFQLLGPVGFNFLLSSAPFASLSTPVNESGVLPAGEYEFIAAASGSVDAIAPSGALTLLSSAGFSFEFLLAPSLVPEPSSLWLLALGALASLPRSRSAG